MKGAPPVLKAAVHNCVGAGRVAEGAVLPHAGTKLGKTVVKVVLRARQRRKTDRADEEHSVASAWTHVGLEEGVPQSAVHEIDLADSRFVVAAAAADVADTALGAGTWLIQGGRQMAAVGAVDMKKGRPERSSALLPVEHLARRTW